MLENIHWLGHDSFRLDGSVIVYFDPWKLPAGQPAARFLLVTHEHYDHLSLPDIEQIGVGHRSGRAGLSHYPPARRSEDRHPGTGRERGDRRRGDPGGARLQRGQVPQPGQPYHPREAGGVGYVVALDGVRYYHAGDTDVVPEMADVHCEVALLPVGGKFTMTWEEAAEALQLMDAGAAVPALRGDHRRPRDAERFRDHCRVPVTILPLER